MEFLNKSCQNCHKPMNGGVYRASHVCPHCLFEHEGGKKSRKRYKTASAASSVSNDQAYAGQPADEHTDQQYAAEAYASNESQELEDTEKRQAIVRAVPTPEASAGVSETATEAPQTPSVTLTTKPATDHSILEDMGDVTAECVLNLKVTPDMFIDGKFVGTKSDKVKAALEQGKKHVLNQLRQKAQEKGANLVANITMKNAVKSADAQNVKMLVQAAGFAVVAELAGEVAEV